MLKIICKKEQEDEVKDILFTELSKMYLHSILRLQEKGKPNKIYVKNFNRQKIFQLIG